jgi:hypothetical protein
LQLHTFSWFWSLILLACEAVGLTVLVIDEYVSIASHAALQLGSIVELPVEQAGASGCTTCDSANAGTL